MATAKSTAVAKAKPKGGALVSGSQQEALDKLRARLMAPSGDMIKIDSKQFKLPSGDTLDFLDVVIVDFVYFNVTYENAFVKGETPIITCFSIGQESKSMVPSDNSPEKQCDDCASCASNQFGSLGKGKACNNRVLMAVLPTDANEGTPFSILSISPTAVKGFSSYMSGVVRGGKMPYEVVTHIECNPAVKYDVAMFSDPQIIEDDGYLGMIESRLGEAAERLATEPDVSAFKAANDAPKKGSLKAPVKRRA